MKQFWAGAAIPLAAALWASAAYADDPAANSCGKVYGPRMSTTTLRLPQVGQTSRVEVGQTMVSVLEVDVHESGLNLREEVRFTGTYVGAEYEVTVPAGTLQSVGVGTLREYRSPEATFKYKRERRTRSGMGAPVVSLSLKPGDPSTLIGQVDLGMTKRVQPLSAKFDITPCTVIDGPSFKRELVYAGVSKGSVSISYREYKDGVARPAFTQDLTYDLADGNEIGYRGARFQIRSANNLGLEYVVLKPLD